MRADLRTPALGIALLLLIGIPLILVARNLREQPAGMILRKPPSNVTVILHPDLEAGLAAVEQGRLEDAARLFARVPPGHASGALAAQNLASVRERQGELATAERLWEEAIDLDPEDPRPYIAIARLRHLSGRHDEAELWALRAVEVAPQDAEPRYATAIYRVAAGRTAVAVETLARAAALDGGQRLPEVGRELTRMGESHPEAFYAVAYVASITGDLGTERAALERFLDGGPEGPLAAAAAARLAALPPTGS
jgi:tetratricopeptide (TPR) repeat protein